MTDTQKVVVHEKAWSVGGIPESDHHQLEWSPWRDIQVATVLREQIAAVAEECTVLLEPIVGKLGESKQAFLVKLLFDEASVNLWGHGKKGNPTKFSEISLKVEAHRLAEEVVRHRFELSMQDDCDPFDIDNLPDPTFDERLEEVTGRGIKLILSLCLAKIRQIPLDGGGKKMVYEWHHPALEPEGIEASAES